MGRDGGSDVGMLGGWGLVEREAGAGGDGAEGGSCWLMLNGVGRRLGRSGWEPRWRPRGRWICLRRGGDTSGSGSKAACRSSSADRGESRPH